MDKYVFIQHQSFSSSFAHVQSKPSDMMKFIHSTTVSPLQGCIRCPSVIKHKVNSQAYISCHLFHPTARLTLILSTHSVPTCLYNSLLLPSLSNPLMSFVCSKREQTNNKKMLNCHERLYFWQRQRSRREPALMLKLDYMRK